MPAYNAGPYIDESIRSVLEQSYKNIELIVVDDGSKDGTPDIAERFGSRVAVLRQQNAGPAAARNRGIAAAKGEFIAFLDADDVWLPGKAATQVQYLRSHPDVGVVFGNFVRWYAQADGVFTLPSVPNADDVVGTPTLVDAHSGWIYRALLLGSVLHIITAMVRRSVIEQIGLFDENLPTGEDYDFWLRVSQKYQAAKLDRTLAFYRMHSSNITKVPRPENNEYEVLLKSLKKFGHSDPGGTPVDNMALQRRCYDLCFSHGYFHIRDGDPRVAQMAFWSAIKYLPFKLKCWIYLFFATVKYYIK